MPHRAPLTLTLLLLTATSACDGEGRRVAIDLRTDVLPGLEFVAVRVAVGNQTFDVPAYSNQDWLSGQRVVELSGLVDDEIVIDAALIAADAGTLLSRKTRVRLSGGVTGATLLLSRDCRESMCPLPDGDPTLEACFGGRCVNPICSAETPEACGEPRCEVDADCAPRTDCAEPVCVLGACLAAPRPASCDPEEMCVPDRGCVPVRIDPPVDAGRDAGAEDAGAPCLDEDEDGVSTCAGDCDDRDPRRAPGISETCGDCLDADCDGSDPPCEPTTHVSLVGEINPNTMPAVQVRTNIPLAHPYVLQTHADGSREVLDCVDCIVQMDPFVFQFQATPLRSGRARFVVVADNVVPERGEILACTEVLVP